MYAMISGNFQCAILILCGIVMGDMAHAQTHNPQQFLKQISGKPEEGQLIVEEFCVNCHGKQPLIPLGAPRIGNQAEWEGRLKQGISQLLKNMDEGLNAMPARGGCFECTDHQLLLAVVEMLPETLKKRFKTDLKDQIKIKQMKK